MARTLNEERAYMNVLAEKIGELLNVPSAWVRVSAGEEHGWGVEVAFDVEIEDVGNGETGPVVSAHAERWVSISMTETNRWLLSLWDLRGYTSDSYADAVEHDHPIAVLEVIDLQGEIHWDTVAHKVVDVLSVFNAVPVR